MSLQFSNLEYACHNYVKLSLICQITNVYPTTLIFYSCSYDCKSFSSYLLIFILIPEASEVLSPFFSFDFKNGLKLNWDTPWPLSHDPSIQGQSGWKYSGQRYIVAASVDPETGVESKDVQISLELDISARLYRPKKPNRIQSFLFWSISMVGAFGWICLLSYISRAP